MAGRAATGRAATGRASADGASADGASANGASAGRDARRRADEPGRPPAAPPDPASVARELCLRLLSVRPRTRAELDKALRRRGVADEVVAEVLDRYADVGMIDDEAFARAWVTSRHEGRGLARRALAGELRRKGVASETVGVALDELDGEAEAATARALVERRLRAERGALRRADTAARQREEAALVRRLVGMLARKGYPAALAYRVVKEALVTDAETAGAAELLDLDGCPEEAEAFDQLRS